MKFEFNPHLSEGFPCSICNNIIKEGYIPITYDEIEYNKLEKIFNQDIENWFVCEWCVEGSCGAVKDNTPNNWLERRWKEYKNNLKKG